MEAQLVKSIAHLKQLCNINGFAEFYILLAGGLCRSCKRIRYYPQIDIFDIHNEIDDTWQEEITVEELNKQTFIIEAINKQALFYTGFQLQGIE